MPHAALWVVQPVTGRFSKTRECSFNAARGFVGGATWIASKRSVSPTGFNAARGYSLSPPPPLRGPPPPLAQGRLGYALFFRRITQY